MDLKEYIFGFLLVGLFIVSMFYFAINFQAINKPIQGLDISGLKLNEIERNLTYAKEQAEGHESVFTQDNPKESEDDFQLITAISTAWGGMKIAKNLAGLILKSIYNTLGIPPLVLTVIITILILGLIFAAWKVIKTGK